MITLTNAERFFSEVLTHVRLQDTMRRVQLDGRIFVLTPDLAARYGLHSGDKIAGYTLLSDTEFMMRNNEEM